MKKTLFLILSGLRPSRMTIAKLSPLSHAVAIGSMILLSACGDDSSSNGTEPADDSASSSTVSDIMTDTFDDLPVCTAKREGVMAYVKDEKTAYTCIDGDWTPDGDDISSSSGTKDREESSSSKGKAKSSSSVKGKSSSSVIPGSDPESSSSKGKTNSSSSVKAESSSSVIPSSAPESSSSQKVAVSSSALSSSNEVKVSSSSSAKSSSSVKVASSSSNKVTEPVEVSSSSRSVEMGSITDSRDGQTYKTVKIGSQTWMAENLNYKTANSSCYKNNDTNCTKYGRLYTWTAAIDSVKLYKDKSIECGVGKTCSLPDTVYGVCPLGWHLPTQAEWITLFTAVGGQSSAGYFLKSQTGWYYHGNGMDYFGFSALPAGRGDFNVEFDLIGEYAIFWSATQMNDDRAYIMGLSYSNYGADLGYHSKFTGLSVRCLKD